MGQKINPHGLRVGIIKDWSSKWFANKKEFGNCLVEDNKIRTYLKKLLKPAGIASIVILRKGDEIKVELNTAKPGMIIGKGGADIDKLRITIEKMTGKKISIDIIEIKNVDMSSQLVAENIAMQLEKRISFRRAMKSCMSRTMKSGALGIKTMVSGRLGGAEIARSESYSEGTIPLQTIRADIDYGFAEALTTYGIIGVKTWIYKGEILPSKKQVQGGNK